MPATLGLGDAVVGSSPTPTPQRRGLHTDARLRHVSESGAGDSRVSSLPAPHPLPRPATPLANETARPWIQAGKPVSPPRPRKSPVILGERGAGESRGRSGRPPMLPWRRPPNRQ